MNSFINTITDDQGNKYEMIPKFDHELQKDVYVLQYIAEFQEGDIL